MTKIAPDGLFDFWSPDTVAECLSYPDPNHTIYRQLWDLVQYYKERDSEYPDPEANNLSSFWDKLPDETKLILNAAAEKETEERENA